MVLREAFVVGDILSYRGLDCWCVSVSELDEHIRSGIDAPNHTDRIRFVLRVFGDGVLVIAPVK